MVAFNPCYNTNMNPVQSVQNAIQNGWQKVLDSILALNPIPEPLRPILGSRYFWFLVWVAVFSSLGRNLLGERFGAWLGAMLGGLVWASFMPKPELEFFGLVLVLVIAPLVAAAFSRTALGRWRGAARPAPTALRMSSRKPKFVSTAGTGLMRNKMSSYRETTRVSPTQMCS